MKSPAWTGFLDMLPLLSTPMHTRNCAARAQTWQAEPSHCFPKRSSFLFSSTYFGRTQQPQTRLSGFQRVLKTCLEPIIYAVLKHSRHSNGAQRIQAL